MFSAPRADLVPNLVETVKGAADFERGTMDDVTNARAKVSSASSRCSTMPRRASALAGPALRADVVQGAS